MKKIYSIIFLFISIIYCPVYSRMNAAELSDLECSYSGNGDYSDLEYFIYGLQNNDLPKDFFSDKKNEVIEKILRLQEERREQKQKRRSREEGKLIVRLYEIKYKNITEKTNFNMKEFHNYLVESKLDITYRSLEGLLQKFRNLTENERTKDRDFVKNYLNNKTLSFEEELIIKKIKNLEEKRKSDNKDIRSKLETGLFVKLYETKFNLISKDKKSYIKHFFNYLKENGININYSNLKLILQYFRELSEGEKTIKRNFIDKYLFPYRFYLTLSSEERFVINKIKNLEKESFKNGNKRRTEIDVGLIIRLYEVKNGNIKKEETLGAKVFWHYLKNAGVSINYETLIWHLAKFKKLPEKEKEKKRAEINKCL
ncbi:MAG: hypothetical protein ABIF12_03510 [bacterium]